MDLYGNESTKRNRRKFLMGANLVAVAMAGGRRTYGYGAARKEPSGETAVQGVVRGSGEVFSGVEDVSGAARLRGRDCGGGSGADGGFRSGERAEKKRNPRTPIYSAKW